MVDKDAERPINCHDLDEPATHVISNGNGSALFWRTSMLLPHVVVPSVTNVIF